jgi:hypothetical protein
MCLSVCLSEPPFVFIPWLRLINTLAKGSVKKGFHCHRYIATLNLVLSFCNGDTETKEGRPVFWGKHYY